MRTGTIIWDADVRIEASRTRQAAPTAGRRVRDALADGAGAALRGLDAAAGFVPGGAIMTAAIRSASDKGVDATSTSSVEDVTGGTDSSMQLLELQRQIGDEQLRTTTLSNVLKARHEGARSVAQNIR
jgi:hypothetical protein